jgi:hypothetical protein
MVVNPYLTLSKVDSIICGRALSRFRSPMMKFEYQVRPFSAGQPPDQIEKVLNQSGESGWEVVATFVKQDSTLCFVLKKTTGLKLAAE